MTWLGCDGTHETCGKKDVCRRWTTCWDHGSAEVRVTSTMRRCYVAHWDHYTRVCNNQRGGGEEQRMDWMETCK